MQEKGIFEYFKEGVTLKYMDFSGRARRREYWSYALCAFVIGFVAGLIDGLIGLHSILSTIVGLPSSSLVSRSLCAVSMILVRTGSTSLLLSSPSSVLSTCFISSYRTASPVTTPTAPILRVSK